MASELRFESKRLARLERQYGMLMAARDAHACTAPCPTKGGALCGRTVATAPTADGWRCVNHRRPKARRLVHPRDVVVALARIEPVLRDVLAWLDEHRPKAKEATP